MLATDTILERLASLIEMGERALSTEKPYSNLTGTYIDSALFRGFRSASSSFILTVYRSDHPYYQEFDNSVTVADAYHTRSGVQILKVIEAEVRAGWLTSVRSLVSAEIFTDFLDMASHLLSLEYKDPAAVVVGAVLESHLRRLAQSSSIPVETIKDGQSIPKKADRLNAELAAGGRYNILDQKNILAWLDLRNKAAHGKFSEYSGEQVNIMLEGVRNFVGRIQA